MEIDPAPKIAAGQPLRLPDFCVGKNRNYNLAGIPPQYLENVWICTNEQKFSFCIEFIPIFALNGAKKKEQNPEDEIPKAIQAYYQV